VLVRYLLTKWNMTRVGQFTKTLPEIVSRYHLPQILRRPPSAEDGKASDNLSEGGNQS